MKQTPLTQVHKDLKAKMAPFAGFEMPIQYSSVKEEVIAVREKVGVFDVSHMGEFFVEGTDAHKFVHEIITNDFLAAGPLKAVYSPICREDGTVIDDLIAYKLSDTSVLICVNAGNIDKDWNWINSKTEGYNISLTNRSEDFSLLAIQGPDTVNVMKELNLLSSEEEFPYYSIKETEFDGKSVILARTGYTGEDGFEIFCPADKSEVLWRKILDQHVTPCGLASRDVLRLEVCYPLYGHEIHDQVTPLDSALKWTVKFDKPNFIGKAALEKHLPKFRLVKLSLDRGIPRQDYEVLDTSGQKIGHVTSGTMGVTLGKGIALAHILKERFPEDKKFFINIRNKTYEANYHAKAFVSGGHK
jgi:aminomethyltransferase